jgi:HprK-related kinase A
VFADGEPVGGRRHARGVFPLLEWGINLRIMATRSVWLQLHAASMSYRDQGVIFAADSGQGKSTLAAMLITRGWKYLCDEFALIDPVTLRLQPFPKALCIKQGSYAVMRRLGLAFTRRRDYLKELKGRVGYINPRHAGPAALGAEVPARFVVFPQYDPTGPPCIEPVCRSHATMRLFRSCFNATAFPDAALQPLTDLVRGCRCFQLATGDPIETVCVLEQALEARTLPTKPSPDCPASSAPPRTRQSANPPLRSRRELLRAGAKIAYVAPSIVALSATAVYAAGSNPSGICSTALNTGELCTTDSDCCSSDCDFGVCQ